MLTQFSEGKLCFYGHCGNSHHALAKALDPDLLIPPEAVCSAEASEASLALCHVPVISADFCCPGALQHRGLCQEEMDPYSRPPPLRSLLSGNFISICPRLSLMGREAFHPAPPLLSPPDLLNKLICCGTKPLKPSSLLGGLRTQQL